MPINLTNLVRQHRSPEVLLYSDEALCHALDRVHEQWLKARRQHDRLSIYKYLKAVFELVMVWKTEKDEKNRIKRALRLAKANLAVVEPFAAIIACTSSRKHVDPKLRSKWSRVLKFAAEYKASSEPLKHFIDRFGGLNGSLAEYSRRLGRQ
jgi:hypothetical protein